MLKIYGKELNSRLLLGTALYNSPDIMLKSIKASLSEVITVSLRRELGGSQNSDKHIFWQLIKDLNINILPNTAGCKTVKEAVNTAYMAREIFDTDWIKLELINDDDFLCPNVFLLVEAAKILAADGFKILPYTTEDLTVGAKLLDAGCELLMPWGAPIGSGIGLNNVLGLKKMRSHFSNIPLIIDAGIGAPSHACLAMELGFDGVLLNTAVSKAGNAIKMAEAFCKSIIAGRDAYKSKIVQTRDFASPSTSVIGTPFWHND